MSAPSRMTVVGLAVTIASLFCVSLAAAVLRPGDLGNDDVVAAADTTTTAAPATTTTSGEVGAAGPATTDTSTTATTDTSGPSTTAPSASVSGIGASGQGSAGSGGLSQTGGTGLLVVPSVAALVLVSVHRRRIS